MSFAVIWSIEGGELENQIWHSRRARAQLAARGGVQGTLVRQIMSGRGSHGHDGKNVD